MTTCNFSSTIEFNYSSFGGRRYCILGLCLLWIALPAVLVAQEKTALQVDLAPTTPMQLMILDESEKPVANASIHVSIWSDPKSFPNRDLVTDADGLVKFERPKQLQILRVWASKEKHVPIFSHWETGTHNGGKDIPDVFKITLPIGHRIGGFVVDIDGNPISGAKVQVAVDIGKENQTCISRWLAEDANGPITDKAGRWSTWQERSVKT